MPASNVPAPDTFDQSWNASDDPITPFASSASPASRLPQPGWISTVTSAPRPPGGCSSHTIHPANRRNGRRSSTSTSSTASPRRRRRRRPPVRGPGACAARCSARAGTDAAAASGNCWPYSGGTPGNGLRRGATGGHGSSGESSVTGGSSGRRSAGGLGGAGSPEVVVVAHAPAPRASSHDCSSTVAAAASTCSRFAFWRRCLRGWACWRPWWAIIVVKRSS